jgi:hypothetical protein
MANIRNTRHLNAGKPTMHRKSLKLFDYRKIEGIANDCDNLSIKTPIASAILAMFQAEWHEVQRNKPVRYQPSHLFRSPAMICQ